jgi:hypothetical protein
MVPEPPAIRRSLASYILRWFIKGRSVFRRTNPVREKFGLRRLEVYLILALVIIQLLLPTLNIQPNFWIGLTLCVALTALVIHALWIWETIAHWRTGALLFSSVVVLSLSFLIFRSPLKSEWGREHPLSAPTSNLVAEATKKHLVARRRVTISNN